MRFLFACDFLVIMCGIVGFYLLFLFVSWVLGEVIDLILDVWVEILVVIEFNIFLVGLKLIL